jgi:hypothetical protein
VQRTERGSIASASSAAARFATALGILRGTGHSFAQCPILLQRQHWSLPSGGLDPFFFGAFPCALPPSPPPWAEEPSPSCEFVRVVHSTACIAARRWPSRALTWPPPSWRSGLPPPSVVRSPPQWRCSRGRAWSRLRPPPTRTSPPRCISTSSRPPPEWRRPALLAG